LKINSNIAQKSILLGFLSFPLSCIFLGIFSALGAIVYGHLFLLRYRNNPEKYFSSERRLALGGLFLGYLGALLSIWIIILVFSIYFGWDLGLFPIL